MSHIRNVASVCRSLRATAREFALITRERVIGRLEDSVPRLTRNNSNPHPKPNSEPMRLNLDWWLPMSLEP